VRIFVAFLVAPLLPALFVAWRLTTHAPEKTLPIYIYVCCIAYVLQAVVGMPIFLFLSRRGRQRLWPYLSLGFLAGGAPLATLAITRGVLPRVYFSVGMTSIAGVCLALIFWVVARPNQKPHL
jgi:hypothetical protein